MIDERFVRTSLRFEPPSDPLERLVRRRDRKRRNQRIAAGVVGLAIFVTLAIFAVSVVHRATSEPRPGSPSPTVPSPSPGSVDLTGGTDSIVDLTTSRSTPLPESITSIGSSSSYQVSPDGTMLAFEGVEDATASQIFIVNADGSDLRRVTTTLSTAVDPRWAPDGRSLVFEGVDPATAETNLFTVDVQTGDLRQITSGTGPYLWLVGAQPSFSPDGRTILFTAAGGGGDWLGLWTVPVRGGESTLLIRQAAYGAYSPDGTTIAYHPMGPAVQPGWWQWSPGIDLADADGTRRRVLTAGRGTYMSAITWEQTRVVWSPDGSRLACVCIGGGAHHYPSGRVKVVEVDSGRSSVVGVGVEPSWLDDDTLIVEAFRPPE